jgi:hypothetical protein
MTENSLLSLNSGESLRGLTSLSCFFTNLQGKLASGNLVPTTSKNGSNDDRVEKLDVTRRDWASLLDLDTNAEANEKVRAEEAVSADQVMESLGLKAIPGLQNRVGSITGQKEKPKSRMEEKQALEEVMGRGESYSVLINEFLFVAFLLCLKSRFSGSPGIFNPWPVLYSL